MSIQPSDSAARSALSRWTAAYVWWRQTGEPLVLTVSTILGVSVLFCAILGALPFAHASARFWRWFG